jgi:hypothetical protein
MIHRSLPDEGPVFNRPEETLILKAVFPNLFPWASNLLYPVEHLELPNKKYLSVYCGSFSIPSP